LFAFFEISSTIRNLLVYVGKGSSCNIERRKTKREERQVGIMPVLADEQVGAAAIPTRPQTSLVFFILSFIHGESHKIQELLNQGVT
jgi:hypothetical protein